MKSGNKVNLRVELPKGTLDWLETERNRLGISDNQIMKLIIKKGIENWNPNDYESVSSK